MLYIYACIYICIYIYILYIYIYAYIHFIFLRCPNKPIYLPTFGITLAVISNDSLLLFCDTYLDSGF